MIGPITRGMKQTGKRSAGKPHAAFDVAGAGTVTMVAGLRSTTKVMELPPAPTLPCARLLSTLGIASGLPITPSRSAGLHLPSLNVHADDNNEPKVSDISAIPTGSIMLGKK
jgi:hypothetical protein